MDDRRFDSLARLLATSAARRTAAGILTALAFGGEAPALAARCAKPGKPCDRNKDCCAGARCRNGKCRCKNGHDQCGKTCARLDRDDDNCGSCGARCAAGETCRNGVCAGEGGCPAGANACLGGPPVLCGDNPDCVCVADVSGRTRCGDAGTNDGSCGICTRDEDCEAVYGAGAFCVAASAEFVSCCPFGTGFNTCMRPCQPR